MIQDGYIHKPRLNFIDNLRWLMIIFVVLTHVNVPYSMFGGWYYVEHNTDMFFYKLFYP